MALSATTPVPSVAARQAVPSAVATPPPHPRVSLLAPPLATQVRSAEAAVPRSVVAEVEAAASEEVLPVEAVVRTTMAAAASAVADKANQRELRHILIGISKR